MARVPAMGMNRLAAAVERRVRTMRKHVPAPERNEDTTVEDTTIEDPAEVERRRRERARFDDDAAYFQFLVDRAVEAGTETS